MQRRFARCCPPGFERVRSGIVVLEFILWAPVFFILLLAVVEFALIWQNLQQVKAAAMAGAMTAAQLPTGSFNGTAINTVDSAVAQVLSSAGMSRCEVILENNTTCGGISNSVQSVGSCPHCSAPTTPLPSNAIITGGTVRVTVCVAVSQMTPDLLSMFGFSVTGRTARESVVFPYEFCQ